VRLRVVSQDLHDLSITDVLLSNSGLSSRPSQIHRHLDLPRSIENMASRSP
jgi:hypothetical protein